MTLREFEEKYAALDEEEDCLAEQLEQDPDNEDLTRKLNDLAIERSQLEKSYDAQDDDERAEEELPEPPELSARGQEMLSEELLGMEELMQVNPDTGVPYYFPTPQQLREMELRERYAGSPELQSRREKEAAESERSMDPEQFRELSRRYPDMIGR